MNKKQLETEIRELEILKKQVDLAIDHTKGEKREKLIKYYFTLEGMLDVLKMLQRGQKKCYIEHIYKAL